MKIVFYLYHYICLIANSIIIFFISFLNTLSPGEMEKLTINRYSVLLWTLHRFCVVFLVIMVITLPEFLISLIIRHTSIDINLRKRLGFLCFATQIVLAIIFSVLFYFSNLEPFYDSVPSPILDMTPKSWTQLKVYVKVLCSR